MQILVVCTANVCRSPMAAALLRRRLAEAGVAAGVVSAGFLDDGRPPAPAAVDVLAERGLDLSGHTSQVVTPPLVEEADLVLAMERAHVREVVALVPATWTRAFTLKELVRRGEAAGPRWPGEDLAAWLTRVGGKRRLTDLLGDTPVDDVADPIGQPHDDFRRAAGELDDLLGRLVRLLSTRQRAARQHGSL